MLFPTAAAAPTTLLDVVCPAGVEEGDSIAIEHGGDWLAVDVPPGIREGDTFQIEVDAVAAPEYQKTPPSPDARRPADATRRRRPTLLACLRRAPSAHRRTCSR